MPPADVLTKMNGRKLLARADASFAVLEISPELEYVAAGLERLSARTGDARFRHAAAVLRGRVGGRPPVDDRAALAEVERLVRSGKSLAVALDVVSRRMPMATEIESVKRRLRRKLQKLGHKGFHPSNRVVSCQP